MTKENHKFKIFLKKKMCDEYHQSNARVQNFEVHFRKFVGIFNELAEICYEKWNMLLTISYGEPALASPILLLVRDSKNVSTYGKMTMLCHQAAALILKLTINLTIDSPILLFDSFDYVIEPLLIR